MTSVYDNESFWSDIETELSNEESRALIEQYRKTKDIKIRDKIIYGNMKLISFCARKFHESFAVSSKYREREDILQEGIFGAIDAVETFDPEKDYKFSTYLCRCVEFKYDILLRKVRKEKFTYSLNEKAFDDNKREIEVIDLLQDKRHGVESFNGATELSFIKEKVLPLLAKRDRDIFVDYYLKDMSHSELALKYDVTTQRINQRIKFATEKVLQIWEGGITEVDRIIKGVRPTQIQKIRIEEGQAILKKYGRDMLEAGFIAKLTPLQAEIFRSAVLNYYGKDTSEIAESLNVDSHKVFDVANKLLKKMKKVETEFLINSNNSKISKDAKTKPSKTIIEENKNADFASSVVSKFGGKLFLYKYFVPMLKEKERKVFLAGVLDYDNESYEELAKKNGLEKEEFELTLAVVCLKLRNTDMDLVVDVVDNADALKLKIGRITKEKLENIKKRVSITAHYGGVVKLRKYFLPTLSETESRIFEDMYLYPRFDSMKTFAQTRQIALEEARLIEKEMLAKLKNFDLEEAIFKEKILLEKFDNQKTKKKGPKSKNK